MLTFSTYILNHEADTEITLLLALHYIAIQHWIYMQSILILAASISAASQHLKTKLPELVRSYSGG